MRALLGMLFLLSLFCTSEAAVMTDANPMEMPEVGSHGLRVLASNLLELTLITTKNPDPARVTEWDFVTDALQPNLPATQEFSVTAGGQSYLVRTVGFKRRVLFAPMKARDLRIGNYLYLELGSALPDGAVVEVKNPNARLWTATREFKATVDPVRWNPAIHVNQVGYHPDHPKKAMVGYYLGTMGEMKVNTGSGFKLIDSSGTVVFSGNLVSRLDEGFTYSPAPYQQVYEADFSAFKTPGEYRLNIGGLGTSFPFRIDEGVPAAFARTFALGMYHQRCGCKNEFPFTRHLHEACHTAQADVPTMAFQNTQAFIANVSSDFATEPRHTAPQLKDVDSSLYPFVRQGKLDVSGGHHDAGDYSKYTINSSGLIHFLVFAADSLAGAGALDNLGIPESGDGKSDLLQEAKWEADYLAKMQDTDGGFYFLTYPRDREYEDDVTPDHGDSQVVWPKTTAVTAAAVAALAEAGSSPLFKQQFPAEAALYLQKAELGWSFLMNAIARLGKDGSYQKITHYGNEFMHDDELAWAAAALYVATGNPTYHAKLKEYFPNPNDPNTRRWTWWRLFEGYGCAVRTYAFAVRSGRLSAAQIDSGYLAKCEAEIIAAADDHVHFARESAYGMSFPDLNKAYRSAGWYFSSERAFDVTVAYQLNAKPEYRETVVGNYNYEAGNNPVNMSYITGLGDKRWRDVVHQYAQNDRRVLPPTGLPLGNVVAGFQGDLYHYKSELRTLSFPGDASTSAPYPYYDRFGDSFNTTAEFVVMDQARSLASLSFWMAQTSVKTQAWKGATAVQITGLPGQVAAEQTVTATVVAPGIDLSKAQVVWEARDQQPKAGAAFAFAPKFAGDQWVEVEAVLPDGRRLFAATNILATTSINTPPNSYQSAPQTVGSNTVALYHFDTTLTDTAGQLGPMTLAGQASLDGSNLGWLVNRSGTALKVLDLGDSAKVSFPGSRVYTGSDTTSISLEAMVYVNEFKAYNRGNAKLISLAQNDWSAYLELSENIYQGLFIKGGSQLSLGKSSLGALTTKLWHHLNILLDRNGYTVKVDGQVIATLGSTDLSNWNSSSPVTLELGNFDGWVDEVVIKRNSTTTTSGGTGGGSTGGSTTNIPPVVSMAFPAAGAVFPSSSDVAIGATATDNDGSVTKVEFFANGIKIGQATSAPFQFVWYGVTRPTTWNLTARATDNKGATATSSPVEIIIAGPVTPAPIIEPPGGSFAGPTIVRLFSSNDKADIYYTTDGTEPTIFSPLYTDPFVVENSAVVKAKAFQLGLLGSPVSAGAFSIMTMPSQAEAAFVGVDSTTKGNWKNLYGSEGYNVIGDSANYPSYAEVTPHGNSEYSWMDSTTDVRALQKATNPADRVAACWYAQVSFTVDIADNLRHRLAIYCLDWDRLGRSQTIEITDAVSGQLLDKQDLAGFQEGKYLVWDIKGRVTIRLTNTGAGPNALMMGLFFGAAPASPVKVLPVGIFGSSFQLQVRGQAGRTYSVEASDNLTSWKQIGFASLSGDSANFLDTSATTGSAHRYYRATLMP